MHKNKREVVQLILYPDNLGLAIEIKNLNNQPMNVNIESSLNY